MWKSSPKYKHDCKYCRFLGNYNDQDLYLCSVHSDHYPVVVVIYGPGGNKSYKCELLKSKPLWELEDEQAKVIRVAALIAADLGLVPFFWGSMEVFPKPVLDVANSKEATIDDG